MHLNTNFLPITDEINQLVQIWEKKLLNLTESTFLNQQNKQNRTIIQILGHLIDSASNNHQRLVRLQYNTELIFPDYRQDNDTWIRIQNYQQSNWFNLVQLWKFYNFHINQIIQNVNPMDLQHTWHDYENTIVTLNEMIIGYLDHLKLHLIEIHELINQKQETTYQINIIQIKNQIAAEILSDHIIISNVQDALDIMANSNATIILLYEKNLDSSFFQLNTCLAGDILQKFSNYRVKLAIIGDFSKYHSKSLKDFIYESNKTKHTIFTASRDEALNLLYHI